MDRNKWTGCWWCKEFGSVPLRGFTIHGNTSTTVKYCPNCGKPLIEEAWLELERKIFGEEELLWSTN